MLRPANFWRIPNGELVPLLMWRPGAAGKNEHPSCLPKGGLVRKKVEKHCHVCQFIFSPKNVIVSYPDGSLAYHDICMIYFLYTFDDVIHRLVCRSGCTSVNFVHGIPEGYLH